MRSSVACRRSQEHVDPEILQENLQKAPSSAQVLMAALSAACIHVTMQSISARDHALGLTGDKCNYVAF